jgi:ribonuclease-3
VTSGKALGEVGKDIGLGAFVRLGKGEENAGGRQRSSLLSDCVEAVIGAAYLDGGVKAAERIVEKVVIPQFSPGNKADWTENPKGKLQELSQRRYGKSPEYRRVGEAGPAHQKTFVIEAFINGKALGRGVGSNRRAAEAVAATEAVKVLMSTEGEGQADDVPGSPA